MWRIWWQVCSALLRALARSSRALSAASLALASSTMRSMSALLMPEEFWIAILCSFPVALSRAFTSRMPLASSLKVTSICGMPRGAGAMPVRSNWSRRRLSRAIRRSPWNTWMVTAGWLSAAVEKIWVFSVGMVVLRSISLVIRPPSVSMPSDSGVTSSSSTSLTSPVSTPPWTAAPTATTSSGLTFAFGSLPKISLATRWALGMRVDPPTSTISSTSAVLSLASLRHCSHGLRQRSIRARVSSSKVARVRFSLRCLGWPFTMVMKGSEICALVTCDSSFLAFSAASLRR